MTIDHFEVAAKSLSKEYYKKNRGEFAGSEFVKRRGLGDLLDMLILHQLSFEKS